MIYQSKHYKFLNNGIYIIKNFKEKISYLNKKYKISNIKNIIKNDIFDDTSITFKNIKNQYPKIFPYNYLSYELKTKSKIKKDICFNFLNKETKKQVKKIKKKYFLVLGVTCFLLSYVNLNYNKNINDISFFNFYFNFIQPDFFKLKSDITQQTDYSLQPKFMSSIFHNKLEAFINLLEITEGKANFFYKDNLGIATAYGWNPTKNSKEFNVDLAHKIGMSSLQIKSIEKISNNKKIQSVPVSLKKVILSDNQVKKSAEFMMTFYENEFLKVMKIKSKENSKDYYKMLKAYHDLPNNQQAVMIHMAYKVGTNNLLKYVQFFKRLFIYMEQPTIINLEKLINNFEYSYKTRKGARLHDTRVEEAHNDFFNKCGIKESEKTQKEAIQKRINSCKYLVASKTIKINNKG
jgi:hypothetical protein